MKPKKIFGRQIYKTWRKKVKKHLVSFLCPSYNHEKYISFFLDSLLAQTNPNWELIIVDDCSTDNNINEIKKYDDKRIKLFQNPFNMGINSAINYAFKNATGDIMAFVASDDILAPNYVEDTIQEFDKKPDADVLYCALQLMNNDGTLRSGNIWKQPKESRSVLLQKMFYFGNRMLSPGMALQKTSFEKLYPLPIALSQYQDYKMHIDIMLKMNVITTDKPLVIYRKPSDKSGISVVNEATLRTRKLEENMLMDSFLQIKDVAELSEIFGDEQIKQFGTMSNELIPFYLGKLALGANTEYKKVWGYNQIARFINDKNNYMLANKLCGFCYADFLKLSKYFDPVIVPDDNTKKYLKYKKLFNTLCILLAVSIILLIIK